MFDFDVFLCKFGGFQPSSLCDSHDMNVRDFAVVSLVFFYFLSVTHTG